MHEGIRRNERPSPTWPLLNAAPDTKWTAYPEAPGLQRTTGRRGPANGIGIACGKAGRWLERVARVARPPRPAAAQRTRAPVRSAVRVSHARDSRRPLEAVLGGGGLGEGTAPRAVHMRGAAGPCRRSAPRSRPRPRRARKANKDVLVSALLEAQEGGNQCLVNGKRENRSGKTVYFQAGEGFVNSTGHCGGSPAGHQTPQAEECALGEPRASLTRSPAPWQPGLTLADPG